MKNVSVLIVDQTLKEEPGKLVNAAFVLGLSAGRLAPPETFGDDVVDGDGYRHTFLTAIGHYVRKASQSKLQTLRCEFAKMRDVTIVDYTEAASPANYQEYADALSQQSGVQITYRAIYVYGPETVLVPATKNLSRL